MTVVIIYRRQILRKKLLCDSFLQDYNIPLSRKLLKAEGKQLKIVSESP